jgi:hypothetical protein
MGWIENGPKKSGGDFLSVNSFPPKLKRYLLVLSVLYLDLINFFIAILSKHNRETHNTSPRHPHNRELLIGTIPNMLMKRFVGWGDDWHVHMDVMVMVFHGCPLINLPANPSSRPLSQPHSTGIMNTTIKSR